MYLIINNLDKFGLLYSILVGLTVLFYIRQWGLLLQMRSYVLYVTVPILWSCVFMHLLLETYLFMLDSEQPFISPSLPVFILSIAIYYWIGMLLFPRVEQLDEQDQFAYFDYYEHFRKQHQWVMGLAFFVFLLKFWLFWNIQISNSSILTSLGHFLNFHHLILGSVFLVAFFVEHKGLMLGLVWLLIATFILGF